MQLLQKYLVDPVTVVDLPVPDVGLVKSVIKHILVKTHHSCKMLTGDGKPLAPTQISALPLRPSPARLSPGSASPSITEPVCRAQQN
jgi:hypothetical protein